MPHFLICQFLHLAVGMFGLDSISTRGLSSAAALQEERPQHYAMQTSLFGQQLR